MSQQPRQSSRNGGGNSSSQSEQRQQRSQYQQSASRSSRQGGCSTRSSGPTSQNTRAPQSYSNRQGTRGTNSTSRQSGRSNGDNRGARNSARSNQNYTQFYSDPSMMPTTKKKKGGGIAAVIAAIVVVLVIAVVVVLVKNVINNKDGHQQAPTAQTASTVSDTAAKDDTGDDFDAMSWLDGKTYTSEGTPEGYEQDYGWGEWIAFDGNTFYTQSGLSGTWEVSSTKTIAGTEDKVCNLNMYLDPSGEKQSWLVSVYTNPDKIQADHRFLP